MVVKPVFSSCASIVAAHWRNRDVGVWHRLTRRVSLLVSVKATRHSPDHLLTSSERK
jgi:hypothetical protein